MKKRSLIGLNYSLRWFLLVILFLGVGGGLIGRKLVQDWAERARQESEQARRVRHDVALRTLRHRIDRRTGDASKIHLDDPLLSPALADVPELEVLEVFRTSFSDNDARHLAGLTKVKEIIAFNTPLTDAGLIHLRNLRELETLELRETQITGSGFSHLAALPNLKRVCLDKSPVNDEGLAGIGQVASLEKLELRMTPIRGSGLGHLKGLTKMRSLSLSGLAPDAISGLDELDQIERLDLGCRGLTARHVDQIGGMANLCQLQLSATQFDRTVIRSLARLKGLQVLRLRSWQPEHEREPVIRSADVVWLSQQLPNTDVEYELYCESNYRPTMHPHVPELCNQPFLYRGGVRVTEWTLKGDSRQFVNQIQIQGLPAEISP